MTSTDNHIRAYDAVVQIRAEFDTLFADLLDTDDWSAYRERLRRWRTRSATTIESFFGPEEAVAFNSRSIRWNDQSGSFDAMLHRNRGYLDALADEVRRDPGSLVTGLPVARRPAPVQIERLFLSHASVDKALASYVRQTLESALPGLDVFQTSQPGAIWSGDDWLATIKRRLRESDAYLVILTPNSVIRPWIWFETGAAWMSDRILRTVSAGDLNHGDVPMPIRSFQILSLTNAEEAAEIFRELSAVLPDPDGFAAQIRHLYQPSSSVPSTEGWEGIEVGERYFAWKGPGLHALRDWEPVPPHPDLLHALDKAGLNKSFGVREQLADYLNRGKCQVFETDRGSWRREVQGRRPEQVLIINPDTD